MKRLETVEERRQRWGMIPEDGPRENRRPKYVPDNELGQLILRRLAQMRRDDPGYTDGESVLEWMERWEMEGLNIDAEGGEWLALHGRPDQAERDEWERIEEMERDFNEEYR